VSDYSFSFFELENVQDFFRKRKPKKLIVSTTSQRFFWCEISPKCEISFGTATSTKAFFGENLGKIRQKVRVLDWVRQI
jgi:hypothetical protein